MVDMNYTFAETFAGAGGTHCGFKKAKFKCVYINEINKDCVSTLLYNNPELKKVKIDQKSILDVDLKKIKSEIKKPIDVLFGGIVCKGFSLAGEKSPNDIRNSFYKTQIDFTKELKPKISIIENVSAIKNAVVLLPSTPKKVLKEIDEIWSNLNIIKGKKAANRKQGVSNQDLDLQSTLFRKRKQDVLDLLKKQDLLVPVVQDIKDRFNKIGYNVQVETLNSAWYGSSTKRNRVIIVAIRKDIKKEFRYPFPSYYSKGVGVPLKKWDIKKLESLKSCLTVGDALKKIKYDPKDIDNHPMNHNPKTIERFKYIPEGDSIANHIENLPTHLKISKFYSRGNTMRLDRKVPSPTLVPGHSNFPVHPTEHRSITVREAAMITGFPSKYKFIGNHTKRCEHVGNAVPPPLAFAIAQACLQLLKGK